jgi:catechol 2,3-dioxygenase-like lactoylglutathione lyase family enzyme
MGVHHIGIAVRDLEESLRFYRDGLGCQVVFEQTFDRDWKRLVGSPASRMRAVVVAHPEDPACPIELVAFEDGLKRSPRREAPNGLFLIAFPTSDVPGTKTRLAKLGFSDFEESQSEIHGQKIGITFVRDPDGTVVELVSADEARNVKL